MYRSFKNYDLVKSVWSNIEMNCLNANKSDLPIDSLEHTWISKSWYNK